uniref:Uncharacterized protein n=1 Tax=Arundo donax TaxID=35708 RepID=A0A0A8ZC89_ARUDO
MWRSMWQPRGRMDPWTGAMDLVHWSTVDRLWAEGVWGWVLILAARGGSDGREGVAGVVVAGGGWEAAAPPRARLELHRRALLRAPGLGSRRERV